MPSESREVRALEQELQGAVGHLMWVLQTKLKSSTATAAPSLQPAAVNFECKLGQRALKHQDCVGYFLRGLAKGERATLNMGTPSYRLRTLMTVNGKQKRVGVHQGKTASWKKAIVFIDTDPKTVTYTKKGGKETKGTKKYNSSIEEFMGA